MTKALWEVIKKGDVNALKAEQQKLGIDISFIREESLK